MEAVKSRLTAPPQAASKGPRGRFETSDSGAGVLQRARSLSPIHSLADSNTGVQITSNILSDNAMPKKIASLPTRILVAVEGSEPSLKAASITAARYALKLASVSRSELIAVCVVQLPQYIDESTRVILRRELKSRGESTLVEISKIASHERVSFKGETLETMGSISSTLIEFANRKGVDLIVLGTRPSTASMTKMMLGSVSSGVASNANCPVLVVR